MLAMDAKSINFGPFVLDRGAQMLLSGGKPVALGQRGYALLDALASTDGNVSKADLMEAAWPGTIVEEGNLTVQIAALRKVLGSRPDGSSWIVTVPRVGYRLSRNAGPTTETALPSLPILAVLPFQNLSDDPEQDYFADGIVEDIIIGLSRFKSFAVVARNSSFAYKGRTVDVRQVGTELGVRYIVEGSVRQANQRLRVTAQLVDAVAGVQLWAEKYDGELEDVFDVQDRLTASVVGVVEPEIRQAEIALSRRERPNSIAAYDLYLRGLSLLNAETPEGLAAAAQLFDQAVALEPGNAIYMMNASWARQLGHAVGWPEVQREDQRIVHRLCHDAAAAAPNDGCVLARCGLTLLHNAREYSLGESMVSRALALNPNSSIVVVCAGITNLHCGDVDLALQHFHRALALGPRDPDAFLATTGIAHVMMIRGDYEGALQWAERSLTLNRSFSATYWMLIAANTHLARPAVAARYLDAFRQVSPGTTISTIRAGHPAKYPDRLANIIDGLQRAGVVEK